MRHRSIRTRLTASYLLLVLLCLVFVAVFVTWRLQVQYTETYGRVIVTQSRLIARMLEEYAEDGGPAPARLERIAQEFKWRRDATISVLAFAGPGSTGPGAAPEVQSVEACVTRVLGGQPPAESVRDRLAACPSRALRADATGVVQMFAAAPVLLGTKPIAIVHVSVPTRWIWDQLRAMLPWLGIALGIGLLVAWYVGARLARSVVEPIDELTSAASLMSAGDLSRLVRPRGRDEIARLGEMFNQMADRLAGTIATLSAERTKLEAVVSGMVDGVIATDRQGAVILTNRAAVDLLNPRPAPTGPKQIAKIPLGPRLRLLLAEAAHAGRVSAEELPPAEVGNRLVEVHCAPIAGTTGRPSGAVAVLRDVTDLRRLERLRRELTANVSHELRTPLTSIKGFAETLLSGAMRDETTGRHFLEIIDKEANRLVKLVDDLLDLSRLESKGISLKLSQVNVGQVIEETVARLRPLAGARDFDLRPAAPEVLALADRDRLAQVLTNLLDNAIKFTPDGGRIAVDWRTANGEVEVSVRDSGHGIAETDLPHIFERFYKADRARSATPGGSGLGLAITRHIVEAHGGRIKVASRPGTGTTFTFTLPRDGE
jgi:two-component system phosphate regulon sensor histidine kinase PhoR